MSPLIYLSIHIFCKFYIRLLVLSIFLIWLSILYLPNEQNGSSAGSKWSWQNKGNGLGLLCRLRCELSSTSPQALCLWTSHPLVGREEEEGQGWRLSAGKHQIQGQIHCYRFRGRNPTSWVRVLLSLSQCLPWSSFPFLHSRMPPLFYVTVSRRLGLFLVTFFVSVSIFVL